MVVDKISRWHESDLHDYSELKSKTLRVKITYMDKNPTTYSWLMYHWWAKAEPNESQIQRPNLQVTSGQETPQLQDQPLIVQKTWVLRHPHPSKAFPDNNTGWDLFFQLILQYQIEEHSRPLIISCCWLTRIKPSERSTNLDSPVATSTKSSRLAPHSTEVPALPYLQYLYV